MSSLGPIPQAQPAEFSALRKVMWFGILQLGGEVLGWILIAYLFISGSFFSPFVNLPTSATATQVAAAIRPLFQSLALEVTVALVIGLAGALVLTLGFREFSKVDKERFSVPSTLMLLLLASSVLAAVSIFPMLNSIPDIIALAPSGSATSPSSSFFSAIGSLTAYFLLLAIAGILGLVGVIGGQILGVWRVGSRYDETLLKLGAIFTIIPLVNIMAPFLVLIGAYQVKGRLGSQG
ncbi:MAG: DUF973 family protein [Thaumarchaeota archaeon]|nr:DUF973 family protein [Nitrososphaerota archaeon]